MPKKEKTKEKKAKKTKPNKFVDDSLDYVTIRDKNGKIIPTK